MLLLEFQKQIHTIKSEGKVYVMLILSNYSGVASRVESRDLSFDFI